MQPSSSGSWNAMVNLRRSRRAFVSNKDVPRTLLSTVLRQATRGAPSSRNNQPCGVVVLTGTRLKHLQHILQQHVNDGGVPEPEYINRQKDLPPALQKRVQAWGNEYYNKHLGVARDDVGARKVHELRNLKFYGAPVELLFHLPAGASPGAFLDLGFLIQNVMMGLVYQDRDLGSCLQYSVAKYAPAVRQVCGEELKDRILVAGMAVGFVDWQHKANSFVSSRIPLEEWVTWSNETDDDKDDDEHMGADGETSG